MSTEKTMNIYTGLDNMEKQSIKQVAAGSLDRLIAKKQHITLHGGTGIGKTQICEPIAKRLGMKYRYFQPAAMESSDLSMPQIVDNTVKHLISELLTFDTKHNYLVLIDELNRALIDVRQVLLGLFNRPGYIGQHKIPGNVCFLVAINSADLQNSVNVAETDAAQQSRTGHVNLYNTLTDVVEYFQTKYSATNLFVKFLASDFAKKIISNDFSTEWDKDASEILLVPRVLEQAVAAIDDLVTAKEVRAHILDISVNVGIYCKNQFLQFLAECENLDPKEFFKKNSKVLKEVFARQKTSENTTLILTGCMGAMDELETKNDTEKKNFFDSLQTMYTAGWHEVLGGVLPKLSTLDHGVKTFLVNHPEISEFIIGYGMTRQEIVNESKKK